MDLCTYKPEQWRDLVRLWNRALPNDPITEGIFLKWLLPDPNYDAEGLRVVNVGGQVVAAAIAWHQVANTPFGDSLTQNRDNGFLSPLLVEDSTAGREYGAALLDAVERYFRELGKQTISVRGLGPLFPDGVDAERCALYLDHGYVQTGKSYSMQVDLDRYQIPDHVQERLPDLAQAGFTFSAFVPDDMSALVEFFVAENSRGWLTTFVEKLCMNSSPDEFMIVRQGSRVVGYCQHNHYCQQPERVGPFLIAASLRGQKVGQAMVAKLLECMAHKGFRRAYFNSCSAANSHFYAKNGFQVFREKWHLRKQLDDA